MNFYPARRGDRSIGAFEEAIRSRLEKGAEIVARDLPGRRSAAQAALAEYVAQNPDLAMELTDAGTRLKWARTREVTVVQDLARSFDPNVAIRVLADVLQIGELSPTPMDDANLRVTTGILDGDQILPRTLVIAASRSNVADDLVTRTARLARTAAAGASVAVLLVPDAKPWLSGSPGPRLQRNLATSVVVIDVQRLLTIVGGQRPRDALVRVLLEQAELIRISPFTSSGVTPFRMFFGRESEAADVRSMLATSSAAVVGGRRSGKTSLLQRLDRTLRCDGWLSFYADLQAADDWDTFASLIRDQWGIDVRTSFSPAAMGEIVAQLQSRGDGAVVIILDEVDSLVTWDVDQPHHSREAFIRACRTISQSGRAQFIFCGERTIAQRLRTLESPYWNFCRAVPVRQLARVDADALLVAPLKSLGVTILDERHIQEWAWSRTNGHPQLLQQLGDRIVSRLNDRVASDRTRVAIDDIADITESEEYKSQYVFTYWGQATRIERAISALLALGVVTSPELRAELETRGHLGMHADALSLALRMLELYGILESIDEPLRLRTRWLPIALEAVGGADAIATDPGGL